MSRIIKIESCNRCQYRGHKGGFAAISYEPRCCHSGARGAGSLPYDLTEVHGVKIAAGTGKIPSWCPLKKDNGADVLSALEKYEAAFESLFGQCCSNPITNAQGKKVDLTLLNEAHEAAQSAMKQGGV